jgi:dTDP-4-amino-4,6-dideoxygalactose transaminase
VEQLVRSEYDPRDLVLLDSGTSALTLALRAIRLEAEAAGRAPLVALPGYGCFDLATATVGADVRVVLYDIDPTTLGPDWPSLERALAHRPAGVVVAHLFGVPVDIARVVRVAAAVGAVVVDDAAQGVGASIAGRPVGSFGSFGVLSFGRGKGRTGGGGGALLANDERGRALLARVRGEVAPAARGVRPAVLLTAQWMFGRPSLYWIPASLPLLGLGETPYHPPRPASVMADACAGALACAWEVSMREIESRRRAAAAWREASSVQSWSFPESEGKGAARGELRLAALMPPHAAASGVVARMEGGAMPGYPLSLAHLPVLVDRLEHVGAYPGAETLVRRLVTLPCHRFRAQAPERR